MAIENNTTALQAILSAVNALPNQVDTSNAEAGLTTWLTDNGVTVPEGTLLDGLVELLSGVEVGGGVELTTCTVTNTSPTAGLYVACYDGETITAREIINTTRTDVIYPSFAHIIATRSNITVNSGNAEAIKETEYYDVLKIMGDCSVSIAFQEKT